MLHLGLRSRTLYVSQVHLIVGDQRQIEAYLASSVSTKDKGITQSYRVYSKVYTVEIKLFH